MMLIRVVEDGYEIGFYTPSGEWELFEGYHASARDTALGLLNYMNGGPL